MKRLKSFYEINELKTSKEYTIMEASEICSILYNILIDLVKKNYNAVYYKLSDNYDMLYQMLRSDDDVIKLLNIIRTASNNKDFYAIYNPINKIISKLIESNYKSNN